MSSGGEEAIGVGGKDEYVNGLLFGRGFGKISWNVGGSSISTAPVGRMASWESSFCNTDGVVLMANGLDCFLLLHISCSNSVAESCSEEENAASRSFVFATTESGDLCPPFCLPSEQELGGLMKRSRRYNGREVSLNTVRCCCSVHPTSSELRESRRAAALTLSETIRPRRASRKRVGEDERDDLGLLLTEFVEYRRVRRPFWDMNVTNSEAWRSDHRDRALTDQSELSHDHSHTVPPLSTDSRKTRSKVRPWRYQSCRVRCRSIEVLRSTLIPHWLRNARKRLKKGALVSYPVSVVSCWRRILCTFLYRRSTCMG